ncbi:MAG: hypothetical protein Q8N36_01060, partial [bacterium]|nr:hypothetical protein [bacterium]
MYRPYIAKILLVAEAPPNDESRFFYFPAVTKHDNLFINVMKVLYPELLIEYLNLGRPSELKKSMLTIFKQDGFYLEDLYPHPRSSYELLPNPEIMADQFIHRILRPPLIGMVSKDHTHIVLIKTTVYSALYTKLFCSGFAVIGIKIPFPAQGHQTKFRECFGKAIEGIRMGTIPTHVVHNLIALGNDTSIQYKHYLIKYRDVKPYEYINRLNWSDWRKVVDGLTLEDGKALYRGLAKAETLFQWIRDSVSASILVGEATNTIPIQAVYRLIELGNDTNIQYKHYLNKYRDVKPYEYINRLHWSDWWKVVDELSLEDGKALYRGLVKAEVLFRWVGGSVSASIWVGQRTHCTTVGTKCLYCSWESITNYPLWKIHIKGKCPPKYQEKFEQGDCPMSPERGRHNHNSEENRLRLTRRLEAERKQVERKLHREEHIRLSSVRAT